MKTLYVTDLDGTLLRQDKSISRYSLDVINNYINSGMLFTYATARSHSASIITKGLKLEIPVIINNGVFVVDMKTGEKILKNSFSREEIDIVSEYLTNNEIYPLVYSFINDAEKVLWLPDKSNIGISNDIKDRKDDKRIREVYNIDSLYEGEVFYITCIGDEKELRPLYDFFRENESYTVFFQENLYYSEYWCEFIPKNASKANAILQLKERLGCNKIVSFGDGLNDIPMFEISDECYAMENAVPELKQIATGIIDSNENDGVAKWLIENIK